MIIRDALKSITNYPVPFGVLDTIGLQRGINITDTADAEVVKSKNYLLAKADVLRWLSTAPSISEMGVSFSFTDTEKRAFKAEADKIESTVTGKVISTFGYYEGSL